MKIRESTTQKVYESQNKNIFFFNIESSTTICICIGRDFAISWRLTVEHSIPPDLFPHRSLVCTMYIYLMIVSCDSRTNNTCKTSSLAENGISELFFKSLTYPEYIVGQNLTKKVQFRREALCTGCPEKFVFSWNTRPWAVLCFSQHSLTNSRK